MPNLALCNYALPGGHICRQPRLRGRSHCRFHIRNHAAAEHDARMDRLYDQLISMDLPQLLETLEAKLENIHCILRCYPEAKLALIVAIKRLNECTGGVSSVKSMTTPQPQQNQSSPPKAKNLNELLESLMQAMTYGR
jgi:hypothetical protein